jgi:putative transcriptional regulator
MTRNIAAEIVEGLDGLSDALRRGGELSETFNVRRVELTIKPRKYTPALVRKTRASLNASQALFAGFLGISPATLRAWERGANTPSGLAARFLDEIRNDPQYWKKRFAAVARVKNAGRASTSQKKGA